MPESNATGPTMPMGCHREITRVYAAPALVSDGPGKIVTEFRFEHTSTGWAPCQKKLAKFAE